MCYVCCVLSATMLSHNFNDFFTPYRRGKSMSRHYSRIQRVLAENNYNEEYSQNYADFGFDTESEMIVKTAQLKALYTHGIKKEAFIGTALNAAKTAFTTAAPAAGAQAASLGTKLKAGAGAFGTSVKNSATAGMDAIKNTYTTGANAATAAGNSGTLGGMKALGSAAWQNPYGQAAMISGGIGAVTGALSPVQEGESRLGNIAKGALGGAATGVAFQGLTHGATALGNKYLGASQGAAPASATAFNHV